MTGGKIIVYEHGDPEVMVWEQSKVTLPAQDEVLIKQTAVGLNYLDTYHRSGLYANPLPHGLGIEAAGVVEAVGSNVTGFQIGDRVAYAFSAIGAYAQYRSVPADILVKLPQAVDEQQVAASYMKGLTAQYLLRQTYVVRPGQVILVHAAAGGVGQLLCQWALHLGVKVIGVVSNDDKASLALSKGAWQVINTSYENIVDKVNYLTNGEMVPVVYDGVGADTWHTSLECLQPHGMLVNFGNASGPVVNVSLHELQKKSIYVIRPSIGTYINTRSKLLNMSTELFDLMGKGILTASIEQKYKLQDAVLAHEDLEARRTKGSSLLLPF